MMANTRDVRCHGRPGVGETSRKRRRQFPIWHRCSFQPAGQIYRQASSGAWAFPESGSWRARATTYLGQVGRAWTAVSTSPQCSQVPCVVAVAGVSCWGRIQWCVRPQHEASCTAGKGKRKWEKKEEGRKRRNEGERATLKYLKRVEKKGGTKNTERAATI